jgi:hypothetical protein
LSWTWGLISSEELEKYLSTIMPRLLQEKFFDDNMNILSLSPKFLAIASGATPIRSASRAPDKKAISRKNSTRREEERRKRRRNWSL